MCVIVWVWVLYCNLLASFWTKKLNLNDSGDICFKNTRFSIFYYIENRLRYLNLALSILQGSVVAVGHFSSGYPLGAYFSNDGIIFRVGSLGWKITCHDLNESSARRFPLTRRWAGCIICVCVSVSVIVWVLQFFGFLFGRKVKLK